MDSDNGIRRWAIVALALVAAIAIGGIAYQAGVSRGFALQPPPVVTAQTPGDGAQTTPAPARYYRYYGPWRGFGFVGPLIALMAFFFVLRVVSWGLFGWGWRRRWWYCYDYPGYGPSHFDDWHRLAHERMGDGRPPAPPSA